MRPMVIDGRRSGGTRGRSVGRRGPRRGFTIIEAALTTVIVGVGVLAIISVQGGLHTKNLWSTHASIAMRLGNEIREMTLVLPRHDPVTDDAFWGTEADELTVALFDDVDDFDGDGTGLVFSAADQNGPINASRDIIPDMAGWSQIVTVERANPFDLREAPADVGPYVLMVDVEVQYVPSEGAEPIRMTNVTWLVPN